MKTHKPTKTTRGACRTTRTAAAVVADVAPATKRSATRTRGAKASSKAPKSGVRVSVLIADAGAALAQYAHLQAGSAAATVPYLSDADVTDAMDVDARDVAPETPCPQRRIVDAVASGWGTLGKTLTYGLMRTGLSHDEAIAAMSAAIKSGLLVPRLGGGWTLSALAA